VACQNPEDKSPASPEALSFIVVGTTEGSWRKKYCEGGLREEHCYPAPLENPRPSQTLKRSRGAHSHEC